MSLRLILGRAGTGKSELCLNEIRNKLKEEPLGSPIIYLVPDQMTFQSEYDLIKTPELNGMIRAQVFSFSRLAWRVLQEGGGISRYHLSNVGINMMLRRIVENRKEHLRLFSSATKQTGFIDKMEEMLTEFKRYRITSESLEHKRMQLENKQGNTLKNKLLLDKLHDFQLIYEQLEESLQSKYVDSEDYLKLLSEKIGNSSYLKNAEVYIDGFHSFTPQELIVIQELMKSCKRVSVTLTLDRAYEKELPHELDLFRMTAKTYQQLRSIASEKDVIVEDTVTVDHKHHSRFETSPAIKHLEAYYDVRPTVTYNDSDSLKIYSAVNRRAEVEFVAQQISKMIRSKDYRYRDIAVFVRDSDSYHDLIETIFADYQIPIFIDRKRSMLNHPVIELIRSSLDVIKDNWKYDAVFRCVKTDLFYPVAKDSTQLRKQMDKLENYVLANGIHGKRWKDKELWQYRKYRGLEEQELTQTDYEKEVETEINNLKDMIVQPLALLEKRMKKAETGEDKSRALYNYLMELEIPAKIEKMRTMAENSGEVDTAREHDQVWTAVVNFLDQLVEVIGSGELSFDLYLKMVQTGLESLRFALVPPAMDQVLVGSMDRTRFSNLKCTFLLGVNDGILPAKPKGEGVISDQERDELRISGLELAPGSREQLLDENFLIYTTLTSASDNLVVSYPLADEEGKTLVPSILIKRLSDLFPKIKRKLIYNEPNELVTEDQLGFITNPLKALSFLGGQLQTWKRGYPVSNLWWDVYNWFVDQVEWKPEGKRILSSLFFENKAKTLSKDVSKELYSQVIQGSVSRMEQFQKCPFSQFASYGLGLKEREVFRLDAPDIGQLFHAALKRMTEELQKHNLDWSMLSKAECERLAAQVIDELAPKLQKQILFSSNRHHYIKRKLKQVIERASHVLNDQAKISGFTPVGLELFFGKQGKLPPIRFDLDNGSSMELVGRIDRVDKAEIDNDVFLRIIDYKSSATNLRIADVYYGLALQMLTYLDVVVTHAETWLGKKAHPAGVLYFHVHNPMINEKSQISEDEIDRLLFKQFKMKGLLLAEKSTIQVMDNSLDSGSSEIIPVEIKKDGSFGKRSSIASEEDFGYLRKHVHTTIRKIGTEITNGEVSIKPYKMDNQIPCTYCSYKPVCQFDQSLPENNFNLIIPDKDEKILEKIRNSGEE